MATTTDAPGARATKAMGSKRSQARMARMRCLQRLWLQSSSHTLPVLLVPYLTKLPSKMWEDSSDGKGRRSRSYYRFTCAILQIPAACPGLTIAHEDFLTRLGSHIGFHDVELEYDEFNRRFRVKCSEQKFAFTLLDGEMMQWLLDADGFEALEVVGPWVLLAVNQLEPARWPDLGTWLDQFHGRVPPLVYTTYPPQ